MLPSPTSIRFPEKLRAFLVAQAARENSTISQIVVRIVRDWAEWSRKQEKQK